ncbi:MAG: DUF1501 domain-containing protein [Crocinitomicaceae bacterium]
MKRRDFIIGCGAGAAMLASSKWRLFGAPLFPALSSDNNHTFVLIFLRGGSDGLHLLAPSSDQYYQDARPPSLKVDEKSGLFIDEYGHAGWYFHPEASGLKELYENGDMAVIHACGLMNGTRSHFDAMNLIERGLNDNDSIHDGWMARYLNALNSGNYLPGVSASNNLAQAFNGYSKAASIKNIGKYKLEDGVAAPELIKLMYSGDPLMGDAALQTIETLAYLKANISKEQRRELNRGLPGYPKDWSSRELSRSLQTVAQLIKMDSGVKMINVDYGGWDTHERQANVFPNLVKGLSQSISAFYNDIQDKKDQVTVLVMSEFGRRLRANKSGGTDHGHGNFMMAFGGKVKGGKMYGVWPGLHPKALDKRVDLDVTTDYRNVLSNVLKKSMNYSDIELVFPGFKDYSDMGFMA